MKIILIRFLQREGALSNIPWHYSFYKDILESKGHVVDIVDNQVEKYSDDELVEMVFSGEYGLVATGGIGSIYSSLKPFLVQLKKQVPDVKIVVGGQIVADYEFVLRACPIDIVVLGEGEKTLLKIAEAFEKGQDWRQLPGIAYIDREGQIQKTAPETLLRLDDLPDLNFDNINIEKYNTEVSDRFLINESAAELFRKNYRFLHIFVARGCPYKCFFCYRHLPGYRTYSPARLDKMLGDLKKRGFAFFHFSDECITADINHLKSICEIAKKNEVFWNSNGRVDHVSGELLHMLSTHNCASIAYGIESFDNSMLEAMYKKTTAQQNIDAINWSYQYGIYTVIQLVIGAPGENRDTIFNTRKGVWLCYTDSDQIACSILNPYPGSAAYYYGLEHGQITDREYVHFEFSDKTKLVVNFSDLSMRELTAWQRWIVCEAALSYRIKNRKFLLNRNFLSKGKAFVKAYFLLLRKPLDFFQFSYYLFKGITYWSVPVKKIRWRELAGDQRNV